MRKEDKPIRTEERTIHVDIWPPRHYVDHDLDPVYKKTRKQMERTGDDPTEVDVGWNVFEESIKDKYKAPRILLDLFFRAEGELDPIPRLSETFSANRPNLDYISTFRNIHFIYLNSMLRQLNWQEAVAGLWGKFTKYHIGIESVLCHFESPDEYPTPRSMIDALYRK